MQRWGFKRRVVVGYIRQGREKWKIVGVYVSGDIDRKLLEVEH